MLKLTIPTEPNLYKELAEHPNVVRVVVLSVVTAEKKQMNYLKITMNLSQVSHVH